MSFASLKAAFKSVFNSPEEEVQRWIDQDDLNGDMCIPKGITENICLLTWQKGFESARVKETSPDIATVYYVSDTEEQQCGELPMEQTVHLAKRIRVVANIDGWGHSDTKPYEMDVSCEGHQFHLTITEFQLKPKLNVLWRVEHVDRP